MYREKHYILMISQE